MRFERLNAKESEQNQKKQIESPIQDVIIVSCTTTFSGSAKLSDARCGHICFSESTSSLPRHLYYFPNGFEAALASRARATARTTFVQDPHIYSPLLPRTMSGLAGRNAAPHSRRPRVASQPRASRTISSMRAPSSMMAARRLVQRTVTVQQLTTSTLLAPRSSPSAGTAACFASLAFGGGRQARPIRRQHQQSLLSRHALTASLLSRHAPSSPCSSFSTSPGVDELDGGFPTERDFHLAADATLDEVQALVDGLEDTVDDYEANLSVRSLCGDFRQIVCFVEVCPDRF